MSQEAGASLSELAQIAGGVVHGEASTRVDRVAALSDAGASSITFLASERYLAYLTATGAGAIILPPSMAAMTPLPRLVHPQPYLAFARIADHLHPAAQPGDTIDPSATVSPEASLGARVQIDAGVCVDARAVIGDDVWIQAGSVIGADCQLDAGARIMPNATLYPGTRLGRRTRVHAGAILGADGFGYVWADSSWYKVPQLGIVSIGVDVEIGAGTTIDRGALGDTVIEDGVKIDNLVHVAHNVVIGAHSAIAACVGIAGSTRIGRHCSIGGASGVAGHLDIADGSTISAMTRVTHSIREPGVYSSGTPLAPNREWRRNAARFNRLDQMARRLRRLEQRLARLYSDERGDQ